MYKDHRTENCVAATFAYLSEPVWQPQSLHGHVIGQRLVIEQHLDLQGDHPESEGTVSNVGTLLVRADAV